MRRLSQPRSASSGLLQNPSRLLQLDDDPRTEGQRAALGTLGDNPTNPGAHANYLATTAKCGICHSVHRAASDGTKLLPTANATCSGCHVGSTAVTAKIITWADVDLNWVPSYDASGTLTNAAAAGGGGGPHNDPVWDTALEEGATEYPMPSYELEPFSRYGCQTRRCHATNPHGANSSKYKIFAAKLLFNNTPAQDSEEYPELVEAGHTATYGGDDAIFDDYGATDAAVMRFVFANPTIVQANMVTGDIKIKKTGEAAFRALDVNETHALVAGLTCGRPSNPGTGEDECHAEASYAIIDKGIKENRNHATLISGNDDSGPGSPTAAEGGSNNYFRTDNTGGEAEGWGGNDNRDSKTGHVAGSFEATGTHGSYAPMPVARAATTRPTRPTPSRASSPSRTARLRPVPRTSTLPTASPRPRASVFASGRATRAPSRTP